MPAAELLTATWMFGFGLGGWGVLTSHQGCGEERSCGRVSCDVNDEQQDVQEEELKLLSD